MAKRKDKDIADAQEVLRAVALYGGAVDGLIGPLTRKAIQASEAGQEVDKRWSEKRRAVAAMQRELAGLGFPAGKVDGLRGPLSNAALAKFRSAKSEAATPNSITAAHNEPDLSGITGPDFTVPRRRDFSAMLKAYGQPGDGNRRNTAGKVILPFPFVIAWDKSKRVSSFSAHEKAAPVFQSIFEQAAKHYGEDAFRKMGLDLFGGCYNGRMMRGSGTQWSTHAWGVAVDLDPERNQLKWNKNRASFGAPAYDDFWRIVEAHKCVSLGRARDYDWMHFQLAKED